MTSYCQSSGTDLKVGESLLERGILRHDMVIGFQPPFARTHMEGFAVA